MAEFGLPLVDGKYTPAKFPFEYTRAEILELVQRCAAERTILLKKINFLQYLVELKPTSDISELTARVVKYDYPYDFGWSNCMDPNFVALLLYHGWLPIGTASPEFSPTHAYKHEWLLPKLHVKRCLVDLNKLTIPKNIKKKSSKFFLSIDKDFDAVITGCKRQHGDPWLYTRIADMYSNMHRSNSKRHLVKIHSIEVWQRREALKLRDISSPDTDTANTAGGADMSDISDNEETHPRPPKSLLHPLDARLSSSLGEEWVLVGGELGAVVGGCYVSLTGFRSPYVDSAGTVQLYALGALLHRCGFRMWDMGMGMAYKTALGGVDVPRGAFVEQLHAVRDIPTELDLAVVEGKEMEWKQGEAAARKQRTATKPSSDVPDGVVCARDIINVYSK